MNFTSPIANPSVIIRKKVFDDIGLLDIEKDPADDYDFLTRAIINNKIIMNLKQILIYYRVHQYSLSRIKHLKQINNAFSSRKKLVDKGILNNKVSHEEFLIINSPEINKNDIISYKKIIENKYNNLYFYKRKLFSLLYLNFSRSLINNNQRLIGFAYICLAIFYNPNLVINKLFKYIFYNPNLIMNKFFK